MKILKSVIIFLCLFISYAVNQNVYSKSSGFSLKTRNSLCTVNSKKEFKIIQGEGQDFLIQGLISDLWKISVQNKSTGKKYDLQQCNNYEIIEEEGEIHIIYDALSSLNEKIPVNAEFTISVKNDAFCFSGSVKSSSDQWIIRTVNYPCLSKIILKNKNINIYWPEGLGKRYDDPEILGDKNFYYPSGRGSMPWFSVNSPDVGLYIGCHDSLQNVRMFELSYHKSENAFSTSIYTPVFNTEYEIPDIMVKPYNGGWYNASRFYRNWYDKHFSVASPCDWVINDSGWLLAILKQQNFEVMWPYKDIDKLCDIAERYNLSTIGLFGWAVGGHDHLYPNYPPDNLMGGKEELKKAIERAHKRGIKIILYANGKIMDTSTDYYQYNGLQTIMLKENRTPFLHFFVKQKNATPVIFAEVCNGSALWRKTMSDLGMQAVSLGADGILYDQLGVLDPILCFSENHDHRPGQADSKYRLQMINEIRQKVKELNPDFIVMTEASNDLVLRGIEYTHGWGTGTAPSMNAFPELYRYTFPELVETQRNPNPMITRTDANFAALYGLRHEVESRYPGDVKYLLKGSFTPDDYSNVVSPPNFTKMNSAPAGEAEEYVHELIGFEKQNPEFFRQGKFIDQTGIDINGEDILAKGFLNDEKLGIVVWNKSQSEKRNFSISVNGYRLVSASEPGKSTVEAFSPLNANSIRLLVYEKRKM